MIGINDYEAMSMIDLPDGERERLSRSFEALAESFVAIERVDTGGVEPLVTVLNLNNIMREDEAKKLFTREEILANAPEQYDGYFQVPGTLI